MRVLFSCLPAYGHLQPMIPLAIACRDAGHDVLVATGPDLMARPAELGLDAAAVGPSRAEGTELARRGSAGAGTDPATRRTWDSYTYVHHFPSTVARARATDLRPLVQQWSAELVVHDVTDFAAPLSASAAGIPSALHSWGPPLPGRLMARAGSKAVPLWDAAGLPAPTAGGMHRGLYLDICPPALWPADAGEVPRVQPLQPSALGEGGELPLLDKVERLPHAATAHLTLGTVSNQSIETFRLLLDYLEPLPLNVVVTVGPDQEPAILGDQPDHVLVASYLPIHLLLAHCHVVIAHGGSGTMLAALRAGLPQLIFPFDADNYRNANLCERAGAGLQISLRGMSDDAVRAAVTRLLEDTAFSTAASEVGDQIRAMPTPDEVVRVLERFAAGGATPAARPTHPR